MMFTEGKMSKMLYLLLKELKPEDIEVGDTYLVGVGDFNSLQLARVTSVEKWGFAYSCDSYGSNERFHWGWGNCEMFGEPPKGSLVKGILVKKRQGHLELLMNEELLRQLSNSP